MPGESGEPKNEEFKQPEDEQWVQNEKGEWISEKSLFPRGSAKEKLAREKRIAELKEKLLKPDPEILKAKDKLLKRKKP